MRLTRNPRPDFWISDRDHGERPIDPTLIKAAEDAWPRAYEMVRSILRDGSGAAELLERVVHEIAEAQQRGRLPVNLHSPKSLLLTRLYQRVINEIRRNRRISYVGTLVDLEALNGSRKHKHIVAGEVYREVLIAQLLSLMDPDSRRLMMLRLLDYRWSEIGLALKQRTGTVRERFRVALKHLSERLSSREPRDSGGKREK